MSDRDSRAREPRCDGRRLAAQARRPAVLIFGELKERPFTDRMHHRHFLEIGLQPRPVT